MTFETVLIPDPAGAAQASSPVSAQHNASLTDIANFQQAMDGAGAPPGLSPDAIEPALRGMMETIQQINVRAEDLSATAEAAAASDSEMTPGEMIMLTVRCHEFLFNCQLTSNIANRTSDGLQQLFRQQS
jgi:hypothetical protein